MQVLLSTDIFCAFTTNMKAYAFPCIHSTGVPIFMLVKHQVCFVKSEVITTIKAPPPQTLTVLWQELHFILQS